MLAHNYHQLPDCTRMETTVGVVGADEYEVLIAPH